MDTRLPPSLDHYRSELRRPVDTSHRGKNVGRKKKQNTELNLNKEAAPFSQWASKEQRDSGYRRGNPAEWTADNDGWGEGWGMETKRP